VGEMIVEALLDLGRTHRTRDHRYISLPRNFWVSG
jgi:hypothetical protein